MCSVIPHVPVRDDGAVILGRLIVLGWPHVFLDVGGGDGMEKREDLL